MKKILKTPITKDMVKELKAGDSVEITGTIYTARDAAHKRMLENYEKGIALPIDLNNAAIYFAGPAPAKPGEPIGSVGPTTSYRMDAYSPKTMDLGLTC
ncbi:MAG: fumarate hydratase C-terminal domain-containing protein, partial [Firmicutes bacterium]|nr:fumarate hydratase C-terminal domain-containing protein [Bacillota bacterium]